MEKKKTSGRVADENVREYGEYHGWDKVGTERKGSCRQNRRMQIKSKIGNDKGAWEGRGDGRRKRVVREGNWEKKRGKTWSICCGNGMNLAVNIRRKALKECGGQYREIRNVKVS